MQEVKKQYAAQKMPLHAFLMTKLKMTVVRKFRNIISNKLFSKLYRTEYITLYQRPQIVPKL